MKTSLKLYRKAPPLSRGSSCALTIGNFDGVHRGHQAILTRVRQAAHDRGLTPSVLTFEPHPREYFAELNQRPELAPTRIFNLRDKVQALVQQGMSQIIIERFNARLADMSANSFIEELLVKSLQTRWLLVGEDFRFGRKRSGDIDLLREAGMLYGFEVHTLADIEDYQGFRVSSSEVRTALAVGDLVRAESLLGRKFHVSGHVIHGQKLGRTLGYPTLNLRVPPRCAIRSGIYIVRVHGLGEHPRPAVASLGVRPTVEDNGRVLLESHLLDGSADAYGKLIRVEFLHKLRDEEKFSDLPSLTAAIADDARHARAYFAVHGL